MLKRLSGSVCCQCVRSFVPGRTGEKQSGKRNSLQSPRLVPGGRCSSRRNLLSGESPVCPFRVFQECPAHADEVGFAFPNEAVRVSDVLYAAREQNTVGVTSQDLVNAIPGSVYCPSLPELTQWLRENAREGDLILTVGAGDIYKAGNALLNK